MEKIKGFVQKNKKTILIVGGIAVLAIGGYAVYKYKITTPGAEEILEAGEAIIETVG